MDIEVLSARLRGFEAGQMSFGALHKGLRPRSGASGGNRKARIGVLVDHDALVLGVTAQDVIDTEGATDEAVIAAATGMAVIGNDQTIQPTLHLEDEPFSDGAHFWSDQGWKKPQGRPGQGAGDGAGCCSKALRSGVGEGVNPGSRVARDHQVLIPMSGS